MPALLGQHAFAEGVLEDGVVAGVAGGEDMADVLGGAGGVCGEQVGGRRIERQLDAVEAFLPVAMGEGVEEGGPDDGGGAGLTEGFGGGYGAACVFEQVGAGS